MKLLVNYLAVAAGGSLGAMARYAVAMASARLFGGGFPIGTFIINITGSFILGWFLAAITQRAIVSDVVRFGVAVGFVGAYTTFSTYMVESDALMRDGAWFKAIVNVVGSIIVGLIAVRVGAWVGAR